MKLEDVILRDTRTNQPAAATANEGYLYYVTDEGLLERSSGSSWQVNSPKGYLWFGCGRGYATESLASVTEYSDDGAWDSSSTTETDVGIIMPIAGTLKNFYIDVSANTLDAGNTVFTIMLNGVATSITKTVAFGVTSVTSDLVHTATIAIGDRISLRAVVSGSTGMIKYSFSMLLQII